MWTATLPLILIPFIELNYIYIFSSSFLFLWSILKILTAEWLESSPPNIGVGGSNSRGLKCDNQKGYVAGWIYPEYSVAELARLL